MKKIIIAWVFAFLALSAPCFGAGLVEFYTTADKAQLEAETARMGESLRTMFSQGDVDSKLRDIDFAEYYANMQKLVFYGAKLANYCDYEAELTFARDKEIFKGLPKHKQEPGAKEEVKAAKEFAGAKYEGMSANIKDEIATYTDLIHQALDACQSVAENDLTGIMEHAPYRRRIERMMQGRKFSEFKEARPRLSSRWPKIAGAIDQQFAIWQPPTPDADSPIIAPDLLWPEKE